MCRGCDGRETGVFCGRQNHPPVVIEARRTPKRTEVAGISSHVADHHRMWLPGTKGTTNGSALYPVNFFSGKLLTFFGGQKIHRNPVRCGVAGIWWARAFQRGTASRNRWPWVAEKFLDVLIQGACSDFQRRKNVARACGRIEAGDSPRKRSMRQRWAREGERNFVRGSASHARCIHGRTWRGLAGSARSHFRGGTRSAIPWLDWAEGRGARAVRSLVRAKKKAAALPQPPSREIRSAFA